MKENCTADYSVSIGGTQKKSNNPASARELKMRPLAKWSSNPGRWQNLTGIMISATLLVIGLLGAAILAAPTTAQAAEVSIGISVRIGPPPLPVYAQPVCPGPGYMWTPGYWAYDPDNGYFWVPGTWVMAPAPAMFWTPGYWGWGGSAFFWHAGYWGPHIGFYGGVNYGFGYNGRGFEGGEWRGGSFFYNRSVTNVNVTNVTNVYSRTVVNNYSVNRVSYNGGAGGLSARATPGELAAEHDHHVEATSIQRQHEVAAHNDRSQFVSVNHGVPGVAATGRPGDFKGAGVVHSARAGGAVNPEVYHGANSDHATGGRSPNPGGGGTHPVMTSHSNPPASHNPGATPGGTAGGGYHSTPPSHNQPSHVAASPQHNAPSHESAPSKQTQSHASQSQAHTSKPSGGEGSAKHDSEPHH
ncbi:MAG: YXWGXW repeat-containing protein [Terriglobia bacterium]